MTILPFKLRAGPLLDNHLRHNLGQDRSDALRRKAAVTIALADNIPPFHTRTTTIHFSSECPTASSSTA